MIFDINKCVLCHEPLCSKSCKKFDPAKVLRSIQFENEHFAVGQIKDLISCADCEGRCEEGCPAKVPVKQIFTAISRDEKYQNDFKFTKKVDLSCDICGVKLENPFLLSSSVVGSNYEMCAKAFRMGWAGVSFKTISLMDMHEASPRYIAVKSNENTFRGFKNIEQLSVLSLEENMEIFRRLKKEFPEKVIIASIMGRNEDEWELLAKKATEAGADVIELNFSCPNMEEKNVGVDIGQDPELCKRFTAAAKRGTKIPVLAKMTPNITDMRIPARSSIDGGADGIAAINTIKSITGVELDSMVAQPDVNGKSAIGGYSGRAVKPIALRFIAELAQDSSIKNTHISGMGGIYTWKDALEFIALGSGSLQVTTSVMEYGYRIVEDLISGLSYWMYQNNISSVKELIGKALPSVVDLNEVERDTVLFPVFDKEKCMGCGRCYVSCSDGGHQAIIFDESRFPKLNGSKCVGCHLCKLVCTANAISVAKKRISRKS